MGLCSQYLRSDVVLRGSDEKQPNALGRFWLLKYVLAGNLLGLLFFFSLSFFLSLSLLLWGGGLLISAPQTYNMNLSLKEGLNVTS